MHYFIEIFKGILIGAGAILPGISSGVICVSLGIYEKLINSITTFFHDIKKNIIFLLPIITGTLIGIIIFGKMLKFLFNNYSFYLLSIFGGLILGCIPRIIKESNLKKIQLKHVLSFLFTFILSLFLISLENIFTCNASNNLTNLPLVFTGILMSFGIIIPGVSSTVILMILGKYDQYLSAISMVEFDFLFPLAIGIMIGSATLLIVMKYLFKHFKEITYFSIIGFVLGSIPAIIPPIGNVQEFIMSAILIFISFYISKKLSALH